ncbi:hypothetical protein PRZ48_006810 [Zasmidium cellare]|uniref:Uncharacterized protein n=1 Tax=Zasmidium cellare TaxID=395010 RepID=A0ABR0EHL3_ZASCE|nr:hypothetical protein PRZ48_006810 [Zasmidium cellare]
MSSNTSTDAPRAANWDDIAAKTSAQEKMSKGPEGHQDSAADVPGQKEKSKVGKAVDAVVGGTAKGESGSSGTAEKVMEGLKGGNPAS